MSFGGTDIRSHLPHSNEFAGERIGDWELKQEVGRGNLGVVYEATKTTYGVTDRAAVKIVPEENLIAGWQQEMAKAIPLRGIPQTIQYLFFEERPLKGRKFVCIFSEFIDGPTLDKYARTNKDAITIAFIYNLIDQLLQALLAMQSRGIRHGDLHAKNIMVVPADDRFYSRTPTLKVGDFGIGGSHNGLKPKDDRLEIASTCAQLIQECIDRSALDNAEDRVRYDYLLTEFLPKRLMDQNPSVGAHATKYRDLLDTFRAESAALSQRAHQAPVAQLSTPFDYLSCEQIGDSFSLLRNSTPSASLGMTPSFTGLTLFSRVPGAAARQLSFAI